MKQGIHPQYMKATVTCACVSFETGSTKEEIRVEFFEMPSSLKTKDC